MKVTAIAALGAVLGFLAGIVLNEIAAIVGVLAFDEAPVWKAVPLLTAPVGVALAVRFVASRHRREGRR